MPVPIPRSAQPLQIPPMEDNAALIMQAAQMRQQETMRRQQMQMEALDNFQRMIQSSMELTQQKRDAEMRDTQASELLKLKKDELAQEKALKERELKLREREFGTGPKGMTPAEVSSDRAFGQEYNRYVAAGGYTDVQSQISILEGVLSRLEGGKENLTGGGIGALPDFFRKRVNAGSMDAQQAVEQSVQRTLKQVLGGQFTEREGQLFMQRGYDPSLPEKKNAGKLRVAIGQLKQMAAAKQRAVEYYEEHGTLKGFKGQIPSASVAPDQEVAAAIVPAKAPIGLKGSKASRLEELRRKRGK